MDVSAAAASSPGTIGSPLTMAGWGTSSYGDAHAFGHDARRVLERGVQDDHVGVEEHHRVGQADDRAPRRNRATPLCGSSSSRATPSDTSSIVTFRPPDGRQLLEQRRNAQRLPEATPCAALAQAPVVAHVEVSDLSRHM